MRNKSRERHSGGLVRYSYPVLHRPQMKRGANAERQYGSVLARIRLFQENTVGQAIQEFGKCVPGYSELQSLTSDRGLLLKSSCH